MNGDSYRLKQSRRKRASSSERRTRPPPNAPRGRRASSATLQRPFYPAYSTTSHLFTGLLLLRPSGLVLLRP